MTFPELIDDFSEKMSIFATFPREKTIKRHILNSDKPMVSVEIILPSVALRPFVHHYWIMKTCQTSMSQIIMPVGCMKWMFHRKRPLDVNGIQAPGLKASVVGLYDKAIHVNSTEDVEMITVFFMPYAAKTIMNIPCQEFSNSNVSLDSMEDYEFKILKERILEAESTELCIRMIEEFILKRLTRNQDSTYIKPLTKVFEVLRANPEVRINELADTACLSERQFRRIFIDNVGMSPKQLQRLLRFNLATKELLAINGSGIDYLVNKYGYTDHSHLNREFRDIVGMTPTDYLTYLSNIRKADGISTLRSYYAIKG